MLHVVLRALTYNFKANISNRNISETVKASVRAGIKMRAMSFIEVDICRRMALLRML